jgi:flagellar basal-body rod modification protein FlgD
MTETAPIPYVIGSQASTTAPGRQPTNQLDQDAFLKLLVAQLQYQDPMSPSDNQQFIQEQATFSTVESLNNLQTTMTAMQASDQFAQGVALIGKNVTYVDSQGNIGSGAVSAVSNASGTVELNVGGAAIDASSVVQVDDGTEAAGA